MWRLVWSEETVDPTLPQSTHQIPFQRLWVIQGALSAGHFVWRSNSQEPLKDNRMTRVTFGISASSFAANMAVKQNAMDVGYSDLLSGAR